MIAVIDYGMGNLRSVEKALKVCGAKAKVTSSQKELRRADKIVFPGVGAFGDTMKELKKYKLVEPMKAEIASGKPFLGLCVGLQVLFESSEESPGVKGLGIFKGRVRKFRFSGKDRGLKVPQMGWNDIRLASRASSNSPLMKGIPDGAYLYFVHSYYIAPEDLSIALTVTRYGFDFVSSVARDNIFGLQFHPEKSQETGLKILKNFVKLSGNSWR